MSDFGAIKGCFMSKLCKYCLAYYINNEAYYSNKIEGVDIEVKYYKFPHKPKKCECDDFSTSAEAFWSEEALMIMKKGEK